MPFNEADLAGMVLNLFPVSWMNQYNMTHLALSETTRALVQDLEAIERVMDKKHEAGFKA